MPTISPFRAIRYPVTEQSSTVAPPYDVLSADDKAALLNRNASNIVAIDLPHFPPKTAGPDNVYAAAASTLANWLATGVLKQDLTPALYPYQQTYTHAGNTYKRRGFFTRVRLEAFGPGSSIHPHEQTFSGPKEDRLKLLRATNTNLSPVFGLYDDPANDITDLLFEAIINTDPLATADLPSQDHKSVVTSQLWSVTDPAVIADVTKMMADRHIYIADGHHRYTTSLNYRKEIADARGTPVALDEPLNFAMFVLIAMQDPGLIIMPTHRVIASASLKDFYLDGFKEAAEKYFQVLDTKFKGDSLDALEIELPGFGPHAMGVYDPIEDTALILRPLNEDPLAALPETPDLAGKSAAWRQLDVAILQHLVFDKIVAPTFANPNASMSWAFPHEAHEVTALCRSGDYRVGFLLQPTPLQSVRDLCNANELMPQKSTFFYPKLATGLALNPLG